MPVEFSNSSIRTYVRCKKQYHYKYIQGLEPRRPEGKLKFGSDFHWLMANLYNGGDWKAEYEKLVKRFKRLSLEDREYYGLDYCESIKDLLTAYIFHWRREEENWEILHVEEKFRVTNPSGDILTFIPDMVIRDLQDNTIWVVDHKTVKSMPDADMRMGDMQSTIYPWALENSGMFDEPITGFIFNYVRRKAPTVPKINLDGSISKARISTTYYTMYKFLVEYYGDKKKIPKHYRQQLAALKLDTSYFKRSRIVKSPELIRNQIAELDAVTQDLEAHLEMEEDLAQTDPPQDPWYRSKQMACDWDCSYYDLCFTELMGNDSTFMRKRNFKKAHKDSRLITHDNE